MNDFKIKPLGDKVIIKPIAKDNKTNSGIIIPDTAKEKTIEGLVVAIGDGKMTSDGKLIKPLVKVDDVVLYSKYGGTEIKIENEEYLVMSESEVYGIINNSEDKRGNSNVN